MSMKIIIPLVLFLIYHALNVYTDTKYRITKNVWHLIFLVVGLVFYYVFAPSNAWYHPLAAMGITLVIGLILEMARMSSPGDTKMLVVTALLMTMMLPHHGFFRIALAVVIFHLFLFALFTYGKLFKELGVKQTFKNQWNDIKAIFMPGVPISRYKVYEHFPGAVTIMGGSLIYFVTVTLLESIGIGY
jgi:Flp pilus assembly protein protease CpaA